MATVVINDESPSASQPSEKSQPENDQQLTQAAMFGQMTESFRQTQERVASYESRLDTMRMQAEEANSRMSSLSNQISSLQLTIEKAQAEEEEEEEDPEEAVAVVTPIVETLPLATEEPPVQTLHPFWEWMLK